MSFGEDCTAVLDRIISDIEAAFKRDRFIDEFGIIPCEQTHNKSPVIHVDHKLGLEEWTTTPLYNYTYRKLIEWRKSRRREDPAKLLQWSRVILLIHPDISTFWNIRKELICSDDLDSDVDLHLTRLVLTRKPKCPEAFNHRRWIMERCKQENNAVLEREMEIAEMAASRYHNNYYAWSYRSWMIQQFLGQLTNPLTTCIADWQRTENWVAKHVSDHSGLHYRQFLLDVIARTCFEKPDDVHIPLLLRDGNSFVQNLVENNCNGLVDAFPADVCFLGIYSSELNFVSTLIRRYQGHESLWYHRRFALARILDRLRLNDALIWIAKALVEHEKKFLILCVPDSSRDTEDCPANRIALHSNLALQHGRWLGARFSIPVDY